MFHVMLISFTKSFIGDTRKADKPNAVGATNNIMDGGRGESCLPCSEAARVQTACPVPDLEA